MKRPFRGRQQRGVPELPGACAPRVLEVERACFSLNRL
jgi:hypothetical protein